jgi:hypothetical protein
VLAQRGRLKQSRSTFVVVPHRGAFAVASRRSLPQSGDCSANGVPPQPDETCRCGSVRQGGSGRAYSETAQCSFASARAGIVTVIGITVGSGERVGIGTGLVRVRFAPTKT